MKQTMPVASTAKPSCSLPTVSSWWRAEGLYLLLLAGIILLAFSPVWSFDFINYDDDDYVVKNNNVKQGLSVEGWHWAWTTMHSANWHPLTWLSLMLDAQLFGPGPRGFHITNLLLHLANTFLLFALLRRMTKAAYRSLFVAALFALHPLHVQSVAWVSERKDMLSTLFGFLALLAYSYYVALPGLGRYLLIVLSFTLSLLAKPMLVTLPALLLVLDYWPLRRWFVAAEKRKISWLVLWDKVPLMILSAGSSAVTLIAQSRTGAVVTLEEIPIFSRLGNALVSYLAYLWQTLIPTNLAVFYPYEKTGVGAAVAAVLLFLIFTGLVVRSRLHHPYLLVGWLWYVGSLVPVIGLVQVGIQARADRYTYIPLIGIFLMLVWGIHELACNLRSKQLAIGLGLAALAVSAGLTWRQTQYWRDSLTLWNHTLDVTSNNWLAHCNLGRALLQQGKTRESIAHFQETIRWRPRTTNAHYHLGYAYFILGNSARAVRHYQAALDITPDSSEIHNGLGCALMNLGQDKQGLYHFRQALALSPDNAEAHNNLGIVLLREQQLSAAADSFREAVRLSPGFAQAHYDLGLALEAQRSWEQAFDCFERATVLDPKVVQYRIRRDEARRHLASISTNHGSPQK